MALESVAVEVDEALLCQTKVQLASLELLRRPESANLGQDWLGKIKPGLELV